MKIIRREWRTAWLAFGLAVGLAGPVLAQSASVTGTVEDKGGAVLKDATVTAVNQKTQVEYPIKANDAGVYTIVGLPIGQYVVKAEAKGFKSVTTNSITLESGQVARVNLNLEVGQVSEDVEVVGVAPILQTENAVVGEVITHNTVEGIPLNGRNFAQLSLLVPGVTTTAPDSFTEPKNLSLGRPYVNGNREQENNFMLDGMDMNEALDNTLPYQPSPDAIEEVRVETNNSSAEFGNVAGAIISTTIRSGSNSFHGNFFEYNRNNNLAANSWLNNKGGAKKSDLNQNIFGATIGGPLMKNKLFFFADYQGFRRNIPGQAVASVETDAHRAGDFSDLATPLIDPTTGQAFPGNQIPANRISPVAAAIVNNATLYPHPNLPGAINNLVADSSDKQHSDQGDVKLDAALTNQDHLSLRISTQSFTGEPERAAYASLLVQSTDAPFHNGALSWTHTIGDSSVNELLLGYSKAGFTIGPKDWAGIGNANASVGIPGPQAGPGLSAISLGSIGSAPIVGSYGLVELNDIKTLQLNEKFTFSRGHHTFKVGGRLLHQDQKGQYPGNYGTLGGFAYTGAFTGNAFADFLLDDASAKARGDASAATFTQLQNRIGLFAQDDWKANRNLTVNLGLAWEFTSPLVEKNDHQANYSLTTGKELFPNQDGQNRALYNAFYGGFEPRVGFAWTPSLKWVVRGGYGIVQYMEGTGKNLRLTANAPFANESLRTFDQTTGPGSAAVGFADATGASGSGLARIWAPDVRPQLTQQWNVFVERQLSDSLSLNVGYVGQHASHMVVPFDFNQPLPGTGDPSTWAPTDARRPLTALNPALGATSGTNSIGVSNYNAIQATVRERPAKGLEFMGSYTYGKALSDSIGYYGVGWGQGSIQGFYYENNRDPKTNYGPSPYDVRHNLSLSANYELPFGSGRSHDMKGIANVLLGDWNVHALAIMHTGLPITVLQPDTSLQATRDGFIRPDRTGDGQLHGGETGPWIDINAFSPAALGTFGNSGVGILRGPGYWNVDLGVNKDFHLDKTRVLTLRVEAFNAFNHPNFTIPLGSTFINDPANFGIPQPFSGPRIIELVAKFSY
jgi:hypothetical protein